MNWHVTFLNTKVEAETMSFPPGILANFLHLAEMIEEFGPALGSPYTKALKDGLFEIRAKGKEGIGRSFFCTVKDKEVIILHSFIIGLWTNLSYKLRSGTFQMAILNVFWVNNDPFYGDRSSFSLL